MDSNPIEIGALRPSGARLTLRPMTTADAAALAPAFATMEPWSRYPMSASNLEAYLSASEAGAPRYVIDGGERAAGAVGLRHNWLRGPYVQFLAVLPSFQGQGAGALILDWLARSALSSGTRNLWVCASHFNADALRFYERHGFVRAAVLDGLITDEHDEILLRRKL